MQIDADGLALLAAVAEHGVSGAARELRVSQPAVSNRLRGLEAVVGVPLVHRVGRRVALTPAGEALLPHAQAVRRAVERASRQLTAPGSGLRQVSLAVSESAVPLVVPVAVLEARAEPRLELRVVPCDASTAVALVVAGEVDLAVAVAGPDPATHDLPQRPLLVDEIVLVRRGSHPRTAPLSILRDETILWQAKGSGVRAAVERVLDVAGVWPNDVFELASSNAALAAAVSGAGGALLPRSFAAPFVAAGLVSATSLGAVDLQARFEVTSAPADTLPPAPRRLYERLIARGPVT